MVTVGKCTKLQERASRGLDWTGRRVELAMKTCAQFSRLWLPSHRISLLRDMKQRPLPSSRLCLWRANAVLHLYSHIPFTCPSDYARRQAHRNGRAEAGSGAPQSFYIIGNAKFRDFYEPSSCSLDTSPIHCISKTRSAPIL